MEDRGFDSLFYVQWHVTEACNLRCSHCYQDSHAAESDTSLADLEQHLLALTDQVAKWGKRVDLAVTGGEPFARADIWDILALVESTESVARYDLLSNCTLMGDTEARQLARLRKLRRLQVSLDGATARTHDAIRGSGAFGRALDGAQAALDVGIPVSVMFTMQRDNADEVPALVDLVLSLGAKTLSIERLVPIGAAGQRQLPSTAQVRRAFEYCIQRAEELRATDASLEILMYRPLWALAASRLECPSVESSCGAACSIGLDGVTLMPDGDLLACRRLPIVIGNLMTDGLDKVWTQSKLLWEIGDRSNLQGACCECDLTLRCGGCRAVAYAVTGDYLADDPNCWRGLRNEQGD